MTNAELDAKTIEMDRKRLFTLFRDLAAHSSKEWLVENFLGHGEASCMYGQPGSGKSVLAQDLALHVAAGWSWHSRPVRRGAVLYVALERRKLVERRAIGFRIRHDCPDLPFAIAGGVYDFRDPRAVAQIVAVAEQVGATTGELVMMIVIDTISRALNGGDENSPKDMGAIVAATTALQDKTGAHVQWVHHVPVEAERMRGHGALLGAMDTTIHVTKADTVRTATVIKANDSEEGEAVTFRLDSVSISDIDNTTAPVVMPSETAPATHKSKARLPKAAQTAMRALAEAIDTHGAPPPANGHIPHDTKIVSIDDWRQAAYRIGISTSEEQDAKQKAFRRASEYLIGDQRVGYWDGSVWLP